MHPIQFHLAAQAVREAPTYYLDRMYSTMLAITTLGLLTSWGAHGVKTAVKSICKPAACVLANKEWLLEVCLEERKKAIVDPSNPPLDWSDTPYDSCINELMPPCNPDVDEGICKMTLSAIDTVESTIEKINDIVSKIQNYCGSFINLIGGQILNPLPARGVQFLYNRILHRA